MTNEMGKTSGTPRTTLPSGIATILKRLHNPLDIILLCVRWYVAYSLSLRNLEEMMAERGIEVDHSSVHRWVVKLVPLFERPAHARTSWLRFIFSARLRSSFRPVLPSLRPPRGLRRRGPMHLKSARSGRARPTKRSSSSAAFPICSWMRVTASCIQSGIRGGAARYVALDMANAAREWLHLSVCALIGPAPGVTAVQDVGAHAHG